MAIIKCPECGQEISDQSRNCIHCGYPLKKQKGTVLKEHRNKILAVGAVFLGICAVIVLITFFHYLPNLNKENNGIQKRNRLREKHKDSAYLSFIKAYLYSTIKI